MSPLPHQQHTGHNRWVSVCSVQGVSCVDKIYEPHAAGYETIKDAAAGSAVTILLSIPACSKCELCKLLMFGKRVPCRLSRGTQVEQHNVTITNLVYRDVKQQLHIVHGTSQD